MYRDIRNKNKSWKEVAKIVGAMLIALSAKLVRNLAQIMSINQPISSQISALFHLYLTS